MLSDGRANGRGPVEGLAVWFVQFALNPSRTENARTDQIVGAGNQKQAAFSFQAQRTI
jgi:hypothetical protein